MDDLLRATVKRVADRRMRISSKKYHQATEPEPWGWDSYSTRSPCGDRQGPSVSVGCVRLGDVAGGGTRQAGDRPRVSSSMKYDYMFHCLRKREEKKWVMVVA